MNYRDFLQKIIYIVINPVIKGMIKIGLTPNMVTTIGFVLNCIAAWWFIRAAQVLDVHATDITEGCIVFDATYAYRLIAWGGGMILFAGLFDMMDGRLARMSGKSSTFGALWDSTLDRYSELVTLFGIVLIFIKADWFYMSVVTFLAMIGSVMVSYIRARAEGLDIECKVGLMQRPERVVVTAIVAIVAGCTQNLWWLAGGMIAIALLANITAFWRIAHCYKVLKDQ